LTNRGNIISGKRLEEFLAVLGSHEVTYYDKKRQTAPTEAKRIQRIYKKFGMEVNVPDATLVASKEESDRAAYREMLIKQQMQLMSETNKVGPDSRSSQFSRDEPASASFSPVMTGTFQPQEDTKEMNDTLASLLGNLLQNSLSGNQGTVASTTLGIDDQDLKGRYYYDKFQFTPFDREKHLALRKAYIEGLVWNLKYYYEGCVSWEWFFPYHYGTSRACFPLSLLSWTQHQF
jgi:5'-3' exonuclease